MLLAASWLDAKAGAPAGYSSLAHPRTHPCMLELELVQAQAQAQAQAQVLVQGSVLGQALVLVRVRARALDSALPRRTTP